MGLDEPRRAPYIIKQALACAEDLYTKIIDKAREKNQQAIAEKNAQTNKQQDDLDAVAAAKHENALQELIAHTVQKIVSKIHLHGDATMLYDAQGNLAEPGAPADASASTGEMAQKFVTAVGGNKKADKKSRWTKIKTWIVPGWRVGGESQQQRQRKGKRKIKTKRERWSATTAGHWQRMAPPHPLAEVGVRKLQFLEEQQQLPTPSRRWQSKNNEWRAGAKQGQYHSYRVWHGAWKR